MKRNVRIVADRSLAIASWPEPGARGPAGLRRLSAESAVARARVGARVASRPSGGYESGLWADGWERPRTLKWRLTPTTGSAYSATRSCDSARNVRERRDGATRNFLASVSARISEDRG